MNDIFWQFQLTLRESLVRAQTDEERITSVAGILKEYLPNAAFIHACIERVILTMQCGRGAWRNPPFDEGVDAGYLMRMIFWPARFRSDIHKHNLWTVSGVLFNEMDVVIYEADGQREINRFHGKVGAVGKVCPPCVHAAENNSDVPSVTLAVFCRQPKGERIGPEVEWLTRTQETQYAIGAFDRALRAFIFMINANHTEKSLDVLDSVYSLSPPSLKLLAIKAIAQIDVGRSIDRLDDIVGYIDDLGIRAEIEQVRSQLRQALHG